MSKASFFIVALLAAAPLGCSGSSGPADGGGLDAGLGDGGTASRPVVSISANPTSADVGMQVTFTASISGGTPPYLICTWRFEVSGADVGGTISGNTCTGQHTYSSAGLRTVTVEVIDSANKIGLNASNGIPSLSYNVGSEAGTGQADLIVTPGSVTLINPPAQNRYAPGSTMSFSFTARNVGGGTALASTAEAKIKNISTSEEVVLGQFSVQSLGPGEQVTVNGSGTIPAMQTHGVYDLIVTVDATNTVPEDNETNNTGTLVGGFAVGLEGDGG